MSEIVDKLRTQGEQILSGHEDIVLVNEEVNQIWDLDVDDLDRPLRAVIIRHLRDNRKLFHKTKAARATKRASKKVPVPDGGISLDDLDLDVTL